MTATGVERLAEDTGARPVLVHDAAALTAARRAALARAAREGADAPDVAVVTTMGALHQGHVDNFRAARERAAVVIATIFVNPLQFGPNEDFDRYPRTLDEDVAICAAAGVDIVFAPSVDVMYPAGRPMVTLRAGAMGDVLEGEFRPGFFDGVLTVVSKLFHLTAPDVAFFGEKDAQQLAVIRRMVVDLNMPIEIVPVPTRRESDGLALSSRNRYLSAEERATALSLSRALYAGARRAESAADAVLTAARAELDAAANATPPLSLDYLALVDPEDFTAVPANFNGHAVLAVAGRVGGTRLIDNVSVRLSSAP
jgi:pantoate--beta-alanine ligase